MPREDSALHILHHDSMKKFAQCSWEFFFSCTTTANVLRIIEPKHLRLQTSPASQTRTYRVHGLECLVFHSHTDFHLPTLHLLFRPQSPKLSNHERLSPAPASDSHCSKVSPLGLELECCYFSFLPLPLLPLFLLLFCGEKENDGVAPHF